MKMGMLASLIVLSSITIPVYAEIYKCLDSNGEISYSNIPCPDHTKTEVLENFGSFSNQMEDSNQVNPQGSITANEKRNKVLDSNDKNIVTISSGERVNLFDHMSYGRYTVFFFYAPWCPSCRQARPQVYASVNKNDNMVLREINIVDWKSDVQQQYRIPAIPYFKLYDPNGVLVSEGTSSVSPAYKYILNPELLDKH